MAKKKAEPPIELISKSSTVEDAYREMAVVTDAINDAIANIYKAHRTHLEARVTAYHTAHKELTDYISNNSSVFASPRSVLIGKVKSGIRKQPGRTELPKDLDVLFAKLKEIVSEEIYDKCVVTVTTTKPVIAEINTLSGSTLRRLGIKIVEDTDEPFVSIVQGGAEAMADAILRALSAADTKGQEG